MSKYLDDVNPENLLNVVKALQNQVTALIQKEVTCNSLDEISDDLGDQRAGRFLALESGSEPTDEDATGSFLSAVGESFNDNIIKVGVVKNGRLQVGFGDDKAIFAGGAGTIDENGLTLDGLLYALRHIVSSGGSDMEGRIEMITRPGSEVPIWRFWYGDQADGSNLVLNGDFATDDFTNWTKEETGGKWTVDATVKKATFTRSGSPTAGTLTSDPFAVTGNKSYSLELMFGFPNPTEWFASYRVDWFNGDGDLIRSDNTNIDKRHPAVSRVFKSPTDAETAAVVLYAENTFSVADIQVIQVNNAQSIRFEPNAVYDDGETEGKILACNHRLLNPTFGAFGMSRLTDGNVDIGKHYYCYTWVDKYGETLPKANKILWIDVTDRPAKVNVTNIPVGGNTVIARNIYRTLADATADDPMYYVGTIPDNTTTNIVDDVADADLGVEAPKVNSTGTRPVLPTRASWFFDEVTTDVTVQRWHSTSMDYCFYYGPLAANANNGDEYTFSAWLKAGIYTIYVFGVKNNAAGKADFYIDDVLVGSGQDWYSSSAVNNTTQTVTGVVVPTNGYHVLKIKVNGTSGLGYCLWLTKVWMKMAGD